MPVVAASQDRYSALSQTDQEDLEDIDAIITRLRNVTASDPYVLTIPQDVEPRYRHQSRAWAEQWMSGTPFQRGEHESLQYQTFFFHEHGKDIYVLTNSLPPINEPRTSANPSTRPATGANTPNPGPKKKISLGAYKKKQSGAVGTPERDVSKAIDAPAKQAAVKGPIERVKAETEEIIAAVAEAEGELAPAGVVTARRDKDDLKRKREDSAIHKARGQNDNLMSTAEVARSTARTSGTEPPTKRSKVTAVPTTVDVPAKKSTLSGQNASEKKTKVHEEADSGMPPRLSPGLPPRLSPGLPEKLSPLRKSEHTTSQKQSQISEPEITSTLPARLSPTIPDNIANTLEARQNSQSTPRRPDPTSAPGSTIKNKEDRLTPVKRPDNISKRKSPVPLNGFRASSNSPAVLSDAEDRPRPSPLLSHSKPSTAPQEDSIVVSKRLPPERIQQGTESLLVKIKYKRARREAVQRILKLPPKPAKSIQMQPGLGQPPEDLKPTGKPIEKRNGERKDTGPVKGVAQKIGPIKREKKVKDEPPSVAEKRPPPEDDKAQPLAKRKKPEMPEARKEPVTPAQRGPDSPVTSRSAQQATPGVRKELLSAAMRREQSQDSIMTHSTPPDLSSTPTLNSSSGHVSGGARLTSGQPSNPTPRQQAWEVEQKRLETLGRELKHAASAHLSASQQEPANKVAEQRLAAAKAIESFLCYLAAFTCADEAAAAADPKQVPAYKTWRSLNGFFSFVKKTSEPFAPLAGLAAALGAVFSARILAIATQFPADGPARPELLDLQAQMLRAAADQDARLDLDALQDAFPALWRDRPRKPLPPTERLEPAKLAGAFKLPITVATSPIRAARAGAAMLREWVEREKVGYAMRLKL